jgi:hypothetical protein
VVDDAGRGCGNACIPAFMSRYFFTETRCLMPNKVFMARACGRACCSLLACAVGACVTAPLALMAAVMAFDAPGSEQKVWVWIASFAILSIVVGAVLGWVLHLRGWLRGSLVAAAVPLVGLCVGWALLID